MLTPLTADAIRAGATAVVIEGVRFMVAGDGTITTVLTDSPWNRKKMRKTFRPRGAGKETPADDTQERLREHEDDDERPF